MEDLNNNILKLLLLQERTAEAILKMVDSTGDILQASMSTLQGVEKIRQRLFEDGFSSTVAALDASVERQSVLLEKQTSAIVALEKTFNSIFVKLILGFLGIGGALIAAVATITKLLL